MKRKLLLLLLVVCCGLTVGCNKDKTTNNIKEEKNQESNSAKKSVLYSVDGVNIKSVGVELVGSTFNFQVVFSNSNNEDVDFDMTKFDIKFNESSLKIEGSNTKNLGANKSYIQYAFTMSDTGNLKVGDTVSIYYDSKLLDTVKVTEF